MDPVILFIFLAVLLIVLISAFSDNKNGGGGFLSGLLGGLIGGGLIYKFFSGSNGSEKAEIDSAETSLSQSESTIDNLSRRAQGNAGNEGSNSEPPSPEEIYRAVSEIEKPETTFEKLLKSSEHDLEELISKAKEFEKLKNEEREKLNQIKEALGSEKDINYKLDQLTGKEEVPVNENRNGIEEAIKTIIEEFSEIETNLDEIEDNQSRYKNLLAEEESELIQDLKENNEILTDVENCLNILSDAEEAERYISNIIERSQSESQKLDLSEQKIRNLESVLQEMLKMEKSIVKELEELERIHEETEEITEEEISEIKQIIEEDGELYNKIERASTKFKNKGYEQNHQEIVGKVERIRRILKNIGTEFQQEEQEEEKIREEASKAEEELVSEGEDLGDRLQGGASSELPDEELFDSDNRSQGLLTTYDALDQISDKWAGFKEKIRMKGDKKSEGLWKLSDFKGKTFTYAQSRSFAWDDANWLHVKKGSLNENSIEKIHYCSSDPLITAKMVLEVEACLEGLGIQNYVFKFDVDELFNPSGYKLQSNIVIVYVEFAESDEVIDKLARRRKANNLPPSEPYKNKERDDKKYFWDDEEEKNFVLKKGNSSL